MRQLMKIRDPFQTENEILIFFFDLLSTEINISAVNVISQFLSFENPVKFTNMADIKTKQKLKNNKPQKLPLSYLLFVLFTLMSIT